MPLDVPTLVIVSIFVMAILGLLLLLVWVQDRSIQALAWWGAAYLIAGLSIAMLSGQIPINSAISTDIASALLFAACGLSWSGMRLFDDKEIRPFSMFAGALIWLMACVIPGFESSSLARMIVSCLIVSNYTLIAAYELWGGRREKLVTRWPAVIVLALHGIIFPAQIPLTLWQPTARNFAAGQNGWIALLALETLLYVIATAFIVLAMAKERNERIHKEAASTDPLTGVPNRRAVVARGTQLIRGITRTRKPVAALMFDLDHFKKINDVYGHAVGDRALIVFARTATENLRSTDIFGRLGGEEFAAILPNMSGEEALAVANRVRHAFREEGREIDGHPLFATLSVGVAITDNPSMKLEALLAEADEALYAAKEAGRNRAVLAGAEPPASGAPRAVEASGEPPVAKKHALALVQSPKHEAA